MYYKITIRIRIIRWLNKIVFKMLKKEIEKMQNAKNT